MNSQLIKTINKFSFDSELFELEEYDNTDDDVEEAKFKSKRLLGLKDGDDCILIDDYLFDAHIN